MICDISHIFCGHSVAYSVSTFIYCEPFLLHHASKGKKRRKIWESQSQAKERAPTVLPTLSDDEHEDSTHSSRASSPMQSEFGGSDVADPPTSPTGITTPIPIPAPDEVPSSIHSQEASQKDNRKKEPLFLTDEQQADVIDWQKENTIIYNKGVREYRNTEKKKKLWADKAKELGGALSSFKPGWTVWGSNMADWLRPSQDRKRRITQRGEHGSWRNSVF